MGNVVRESLIKDLSGHASILNSMLFEKMQRAQTLELKKNVISSKYVNQVH